MKTNGTEVSNKKSHNSSCLSFDKKCLFGEKDSPFKKWCWKNWTSTCRRLKLDPSLSCCSSISSNWIKDLNARPQTAKLLQERIGKMLEHTGIDNDFLKRTPVVHQVRERIENGIISN
jgi:hypothetical protein